MNSAEQCIPNDYKSNIISGGIKKYKSNIIQGGMKKCLFYTESLYFGIRIGKNLGKQNLDWWPIL